MASVGAGLGEVCDPQSADWDDTSKSLARVRSKWEWPAQSMLPSWIWRCQCSWESWILRPCPFEEPHSWFLRQQDWLLTKQTCWSGTKYDCWWQRVRILSGRTSRSSNILLWWGTWELQRYPECRIATSTDLTLPCVTKLAWCWKMVASGQCRLACG